MTAVFLAASVIAIVYLSSRQTPPVPRKTLVAVILGIVVIRVGFYVAFRLFDERDVLLTTGMLLLAGMLVAIVFGSIAVWKQMGRRDSI